jgi:hypothetical protein
MVTICGVMVLAITRQQIREDARTCEDHDQDHGYDKPKCKAYDLGDDDVANDQKKRDGNDD